MSEDVRRSLPSSNESEQGALCSVLLEPRSLETIQEIAPVPMWHNPGHRLILEAMLGLWNSKQPVDIITLTAAIQKNRTMESCGGPAYLLTISGITHSPINLKYYLEIIRNCYLRRQLIKAAGALEESAWGDIKPYILPSEIPVNDELPAAISLTEEAIKSWRDNTVADQGLTNHGWLEVCDDVEARNDLWRQGKVEGIATGLPVFDRCTGGLQKRTLYVIGASPNVGKSLLTSQFCVAATEQGIKCAIFSMEMSGKKYRERMLAQKQAASSGELKSGCLKEISLPKITRAMGELRELVFTDDTPMLTVEVMRAKLRRHFTKHPDTGLIAIDYLQLLQPSARKKNPNRAEEVAQMVIEVDALKKEFDVPVLLITALNRKPQDRKDQRPRLSDSRDSSQIEYQTDVGIILHFPESDEMTKKGHIIIDKQRDGETRDIEAQFTKQWLRFEEV